jgi:aconitate hydratase
MPVVTEPDEYLIYTDGFLYPPENSSSEEVYYGPNIKPVPLPPPLADWIAGEVLIKTGDDLSTDTILPGGAKVLPLRSNIPAISEYTFAYLDRTFPARAKDLAAQGKAGIIVGGENYGQGSSREHAAIAPMYLGVRVVLAKSFARIHRTNLINWGILPVLFVNPEDYEGLEQGEELEFAGVRAFVKANLFDSHHQLTVLNRQQDDVGKAGADGRKAGAYARNASINIQVTHDLSPREAEILLAGGLLRKIMAQLR